MSDGRRQRRLGSRPIEMLAVLLLGIATIGSAFCGYQATRWNGEETDLQRDASTLRLEASRLFGVATQKISYDAVMVSQYAQAVNEDNEDLAEFYRDVLFRPDFIPVLERWQALIEAGELPPGGLLADEEYLAGELAPYEEATAAAEAVVTQSQEAGATADDYILTTLLLASALFFAGVTTSFRVRFVQVLLLLGAGAFVALAAMRIADLPVL